MLRLRKVAIVSMLGFASLWATSAVQAQTSPPTVIVQPAPTPPVVVQPAPAPTPVVVQPAPAPTPVIVQPAPAAALPPPVVEVNTPAPTTVTTVIVVPPRRNTSISVGGGVSNFFNDSMQQRTSVMGAYEARLQLGARQPVAFEAAYVGTAGAISSPGLMGDAMLVSNGVEALARLNFGPFGDGVQPFIFGGGSWVRYDLVNETANASDIRQSDDLFAVPVGAGLAVYDMGSGFMVDGRFTFRPTFDADLIKNAEDSSLNSWVASLRLGYAF